MNVPFVGSLAVGGAFLAAGFMAPKTVNAGGIMVPTHIVQADAAQRAAVNTPPVIRGELSPELRADLDRVSRGEFGGDLSGFAANMAAEIDSLRQEVSRAITSSTANLPIRENLEAPAIVLVPEDTPFRNTLPRVPGSGLAAVWKQIVTLGGGWGTDVDQPGGGAKVRQFYTESTAPVTQSTTYATKMAQYKLMGAYGSVTTFAASAGANYSDLRAEERRNALANFFLNEENALINGSSTSTAAPWGDGATAMAYDGILSLTATANGTPAAQVQTAVGPLTLDHYNAQLRRLWNYGGRDLFILQSADVTLWLQKLLRDAGEPYRLDVKDQANATMGFHVAVYISPVNGQRVTIMTSRFMPAGTIEFGSFLTDTGRNAFEIDVLPQAPLPADVQRPDGSKQLIQGYYVTELARQADNPEEELFMVNCYSVPKMKDARLFAKSTGVTEPA
jgi:hypothetical protein